jgi:hypothetical protein
MSTQAEQDERLEAMYEHAAKDLLERLISNGITSGRDDELMLAVEVHVEVQIREAALEMFCAGEMKFEKRDGKVYWSLTEKGAAA